jgi:hypothetical protein
MAQCGSFFAKLTLQAKEVPILSFLSILLWARRVAAEAVHKYDVRLMVG